MTGRIPETFALLQNYPNPFNPETVIRPDVPKQVLLEITIYNTLGQQVRKLAAAKFLTGQHALRWDGRDDHGQKVTSGIYFYRMLAGDFVATRKMVLMP